MSAPCERSKTPEGKLFDTEMLLSDGSRSANVVKPLISMQKVVRAGNSVVLYDKNPHIRSTRDGTVIKLDVNNGLFTMDMWICLHETGPVFSLQRQ